MRTRVLIPLLAAGALVLAGCGEEDGPATPGGAPPGDSADDQSDGSEPSDGPDESDESDESDADDPDEQQPSGEGDPDPDMFNQRAELIADTWPERPEPLEKFNSEMWRIQGVSETSPEDTTLTVQIGHGGCDADWGSWLHETDQLVIVGGWTVADPKIDMCHDMLVVDDVEVELDSPLGDRTVLDAVSAKDPREEDFQDP